MAIFYTHTTKFSTEIYPVESRNLYIYLFARMYVFQSTSISLISHKDLNQTLKTKWKECQNIYA